MLRRCTSFACLLLVLPAAAWAGGPPMLCLPVAGATVANAEATAQRVAAALGKEVERDGFRPSLRQNDGQWFLTFHFNRDALRLAEIDAALAGSPVSIQRDQLRLFGNVILEVDGPKSADEMLLGDLKSLKHFTVEESQRQGGTLLVTLMLPAPTREFRPAGEFGKVAFRSQTFRREGASGTEVGFGDLPSYDALRQLVAKSGGKLQGLRWNCWGCRALGCVAGPDGSTAQTARALTSGQ